MDTSCKDCSNGGVRLTLVMATLLFGVLAALFFAAAAAIFILMLSPAAAAPIPLLVAALVMLGVILLLLLLLLWCCCGGKFDPKAFRDLKGFLPLLKNAAEGMEKAAQALEAMAFSLERVRDRANEAGGFVRAAGDKVDVAIPKLSAEKANIAGHSVVIGLKQEWFHPLGEVKDRLHHAADSLNGTSTDSVSNRLHDLSSQCKDAATGLRAAKSLFDAAG